ncbi:uncharacterized protein LOC118748051 [Rhagoletis pomonella]|uniref:uncharacterized protein LOC118748051 n=1 Tax=Rhagoletis pomonella TaxID=28610 RepID=UPI00178469D6|nr:uncharacterized protein LOC118748051 [Rhagoletis pomonella]
MAEGMDRFKISGEKKCSHNIASLKKTGGGPSEEIPLTTAEEKIISLTSIKEAVSGSSSNCFGAPQQLEKDDDYVAFIEIDANEEVEEVEFLNLNTSSTKLVDRTTKRPKRNETAAEILKNQMLSDQDFQTEFLNIMRDRNEDQIRFHNRVIDLLQEKNNIAKEHLELNKNMCG